MNVLFYKTTQCGCTDKLLDTVLSAAVKGQVSVTSRIEAFKNALLKYRTGMPIVVIRISSTEDIFEIEELGDIISGLFLIVVVDSEDKELFANCRQLYPRLLAHNEDYNVIAAVIERRLIAVG